MKHIYKYGLLFSDQGKILLCKTYKLSEMVLPGGKKEGEESALEGLRREIKEELGCNAVLDESSIIYIGNFSDYAAGKENTIVEIELYWGRISGVLTASSEIERLVWFDVERDDKKLLSKIIRDKILPAVASRLNELETSATFNKT